MARQREGQVTRALEHNATMSMEMCVKLGLASRLTLMSRSLELGAEPLGHFYPTHGVCGCVSIRLAGGC